jgi:hypothetical protein
MKQRRMKIRATKPATIVGKYLLLKAPQRMSLCLRVLKEKVFKRVSSWRLQVRRMRSKRTHYSLKRVERWNFEFYICKTVFKII